MQLITFNVGKECYAIDTALVIEVIPLVAIRPLISACGFLRGVINYRGRIVPVIDLGLLLVQQEAARKISTRILLIRYLSRSAEQCTLGLIAERATGIFHITPADIEQLETRLEQQHFLGGVFRNDKDVIQIIDPQGAISQALEQALELSETAGCSD